MSLNKQEFANKLEENDNKRGTIMMLVVQHPEIKSVGQCVIFLRENYPELHGFYWRDRLVQRQVIDLTQSNRRLRKEK